MKDIELRIWDYIDGFSSEEERKAIEQLIQKDLEFKTKYIELLALNKDFSLIELDAPSMAFTNKVMESLVLQTKPLSAKAKTDKRIIYLISGVFGVMMAACVIIVLTQIDWTFNSSSNQPLLPNLGQIFNGIRVPNGFFNSNFLYGFLMFDMIVGLMFLDRLMRNRSESF